MLKNRLCYLAVLLGTALFFFCFNGYLSLYVMVLALALPWISVLVSLPGVLGARLTLSVERPAARKGQEIALVITAANRTPFPSGRAKVTLTAENLLTGQIQKERLVFTAASCHSASSVVISHTLFSGFCGQVVCRLSHGWVSDYLGLFSLPLRLPAPQKVLFYPAVYRPGMTVEHVSIPDGEGEHYSQIKPGDDTSELFALRTYREGDKPSQIHWKLSQKVGETLVREFSLPISEHVFFLLEPNGSGEEVDALLDAFSTLSCFLTEQETPHRAGLWDGKSDRLLVREISEPEELEPVLGALLLAGAHISLPAAWPDALPGGIYHLLYLCCEPSRSTLEELRIRLPSARISVLQTSDRDASALVLSADSQLTMIRPGTLPDALNGFRI